MFVLLGAGEVSEVGVDWVLIDNFWGEAHWSWEDV